MRAAPDQRTVTVHGRQMRVAIRPGRPDVPPLLMICGIGASLDAFDPLVAALDEDLTIVRFDVPGVGGSPTPLRPYNFQEMAWIAASMMRQLGHERFDVLGYSWGGALAQQLAWQHCRRVRRLILLSTGTGAVMVPGRPRVLVKMLSPRRFGDPEYAASLAGELYGGSARGEGAQVRELFSQLERGGRRRGYLFQLLAGSMWTSLPWLPTIPQPTLVASGDDDPIIPIANARILSSFIPRGRLHLFSGGHVEPVVDPGCVAGEISAFVKEELARPAR